ncbi:MAG: hypothetical protein AAGA76_03570 [Pseudomonadota bacterium]
MISLRYFGFVAFAVFISPLFSAIPAYTQEAPCSHDACRASMPQGNACRIYLNSDDGDASLHRSVLSGRVGGVSRAVPEGCYQPGQVYGLQGWRFNTRGGHKIRHIKFLQDSESMEFALADHDGNDFADGFVWLVPLPDGIELQETELVECNGGCRIPLGDKNPFDTVVLLGFEVLRDGDNDGHVRQFSVGRTSGPPTSPEMRINFSHDDFGYRARVQFAVLPAGTVSGTNRIGKSHEGHTGGFGTARVSNPTSPNADLRDDTPAGDSVLQSFGFAFENDGHFLEDVGIERISLGYEVWFQDNQARGERRNPDDPFIWRASYVFLN